MKCILSTIKFITLILWAICCVFFGIRDGLDYGAVYFLTGLVLAMVVKRLLFGPRNLGYGYKNGYTTDRVDWHGVGEYRPGHSFDDKIGLS